MQDLNETSLEQNVCKNKINIYYLLKVALSVIESAVWRFRLVFCSCGK